MIVEPKKCLSRALILTSHREYALTLRAGLLELGDARTRIDIELDALRAMQIAPQPYELIVIDMFLNAMDGVQLLLLFRQQAPGTKFVIVHDEGDETSHALAYQNGADLFLERPRTPEALQAGLRAVSKLLVPLLPEQPAFAAEEIPLLRLTDLIQTRCLSGDSVLLHVQGRDAGGDIFIHRGEIFHAQLPGKSGESAFHEMVYWDNGHAPAKVIKLNHLPPRTIRVPYRILLEKTLQPEPSEMDRPEESGELIGIPFETPPESSPTHVALEAPPHESVPEPEPAAPLHAEPHLPVEGETELPPVNAHWKINLMGKLMEGSRVTDPDRCAFITSFIYRKLADVAVTLEVDYFTQMTLWGPHLQQVLVADNLGVRHAVFETMRTDEMQRDQYVKWCREQSF